MAETVPLGFRAATASFKRKSSLLFKIGSFLSGLSRGLKYSPDNVWSISKTSTSPFAAI